MYEKTTFQRPLLFSEADQQIGYLHSGEVAAAVELRPVFDLVFGVHQAPDDVACAAETQERQGVGRVGFQFEVQIVEVTDRGIAGPRIARPREDGERHGREPAAVAACQGRGEPR